MEIHMLHLIYGNKRRDQVQNDDIYDRLEITPFGEKLVQHWWRWFGHIQRRPSETPMCTVILRRDSNGKRGRERPNLK